MRYKFTLKRSIFFYTCIRIFKSFKRYLLYTVSEYTHPIFCDILGERWGNELPDGNWTGIVGNIVRQEADFGAANFFITYERNKVIDFSAAVGFEVFILIF